MQVIIKDFTRIYLKFVFNRHIYIFKSKLKNYYERATAIWSNAIFFFFLLEFYGIR